MRNGPWPGGEYSFCTAPHHSVLRSCLSESPSYEKLPSSPDSNASTYSIAGYSTSYHFLAYKRAATRPQLQTFTLPPSKPISPASLPSRARISQFLILPSHQKHSHGKHLFSTITNTLLSTPTVLEITVEDPNEAFDDLRDYNDYTRLHANGTFSQIVLSTNLPPTLTTKRIGVRVPTSKLLDLPRLKTLRHQNKLAPRQFARLMEMYLFSLIPQEVRQSGTARVTQRGKATDSDDRTYYYWRLLVKQRVYKQNRDLLAQLERLERIDKVEQTVGEVIGDYERLLRGLADRAADRKNEPAQQPKTTEAVPETSEQAKPKQNEPQIRKEGSTKRKLLPDEDETPNPHPHPLSSPQAAAGANAHDQNGKGTTSIEEGEGANRLVSRPAKRRREEEG